MPCGKLHVGQILEKPCLHSRGHIFSLIIVKPGQNVCVDIISDDLKNCHVGSKKKKKGHQVKS